MKIFKTVLALKEHLKNLNGNIGFVPTMGSLHKGHISLLKRSDQENPTTVLSIYLNVTQFNNQADFDNYPTSIERDLETAKKNNVDIVFRPTFEDMYPENYSLKIIEESLSTQLCGAYRPAHFSGVLTVVLKLLNIIKPHKMYLGEKDYQQYLLIKKMISAFFIDTEVISCPTIRSTNGLAISSRNKKLSLNGLKTAENIFRILKYAKSEDEAKKEFNRLGIEIEYVQKLQDRLFAAVHLEKIRLIDNVKSSF